MTKSIINTLNNPEQFLPPMPINPEIIEIDGKLIIYINVPESEQVHRYKNRFFDRWGRTDYSELLSVASYRCHLP